MSEITPSPPSPDAPPEGGALRDKFDAMLLDISNVVNCDFPNDWGIDDTEDALALSGVDDASLKDCIVDASASVWGVLTMRPAQLDACFCLLHPHRPNSLVVVHRLGGGETHILRTLGVIERGIVLIFIPLLTLSADVMHKFEDYNPRWGNVGVYHLDELYDCNRHLYHSLLRGCTSLGRETSSTLFIFLSPQFLINHRDALDVFVACAHDRTLRVIAMDEAHIHVQHGTSIREDIWALRIEFFKKIFGNQPKDLHPRLIALTATLPTT
jgi:superfamily II DNA helicase RecQ